MADNVLVLGQDGSLEHYGPSKDWISITDKVPRAEKLEMSDVSESCLDTTSNDYTQKKAAARSKTEVDFARKTGDMFLWVYYAKTATALHLILLAIFTLISVLGSNFPRE
jgi:hypothetical protein